MALDATQFKTLVAGANQLHHYTSAEAVATVAGSGYFSAITNRLKKGDIILAYDNNLDLADMLVVTSATGAATVTTVNAT